MRIVSFMTQKGGSGKSTLAFNVAVAAAEAGETVALFDLDPQGMTYAWGKARDKLIAIAQHEDDQKRVARLSQPHYERYPQAQLVDLPKSIRALKSKGITLVVLDTQGADSAAQHICMQASTLNIVPLRPSRADADMSMPTVQALRDGKKPFGFVLTQCLTVPGNTRATEMANRLRSIGKFIDPLIYSRVEYQDSYAMGEGVTEISPNGKAAEEIKALWQSIKTMSKEVK